MPRWSPSPLGGYSDDDDWLKPSTLFTGQVLSEPSLDVRLLALLSRLLARRCAPYP